MSFSELEATPFGVSWWNFPELMGHLLRNLWWKQFEQRDTVQRSIFFRIEQRTRWWSFQIATAQIYNATIMWNHFFAKIWHLTWPNEVKCWHRTKNNMCNRDILSRRFDCFFPQSSTTIRGRSPGGSYPLPLHWRMWRNTEHGPSPAQAISHSSMAHGVRPPCRFAPWLS